jgi:ribose transport system permease protein
LRGAAERYGLILAWIAVIVVFSVLRPDTFATTSTVRLILSTQTVILLATLGLMLSLAVAEYDLSIGAIVGFGGTLLAVLNGVQGWQTWAAVVVTLVVCMLFGVLNAVLSVYVGVQSIIVTLGTGTLLAGLTLAVADSKVVTGLSPELVTAMTKPLLFSIPAPFYAGLLLTAALWFLLQHTPLGRRMVFVSENREVARLAGLRVKRIRAGALVLTATLGGLAGIVLAGTNGAANPQVGSSYLLPAFAAAFLGSTALIPGRFNAWGSFVAVYFLVTGITGLQYLGYAGWPEQVFYGSSLVIAVTLSHLAGRRRLSGLG